MKLAPTFSMANPQPTNIHTMKYDHTFEIFGQTFVSSSFGLFMSILLVAGLAMPLLTIGLFKIFSFVSDLIEKTKNKYKHTP